VGEAATEGRGDLAALDPRQPANPDCTRRIKPGTRRLALRGARTRPDANLHRPCAHDRDSKSEPFSALPPLLHIRPEGVLPWSSDGIVHHPLFHTGPEGALLWSIVRFLVLPPPQGQKGSSHGQVSKPSSPSLPPPQDQKGSSPGQLSHPEYSSTQPGTTSEELFSTETEEKATVKLPSDKAELAEAELRKYLHANSQRFTRGKPIASVESAPSSTVPMRHDCVALRNRLLIEQLE
jgi:hypothetical protein